MVDHLVYVHLFLEARGIWEESADGFLRLLSRDVKSIRGGDGHTNELYVVGRCEQDLCDEVLNGGRTSLHWFRMGKWVISSEIADISLELRRVRSRFGGATRLVVVLTGREDLGAFP